MKKKKGYVTNICCDNIDDDAYREVSVRQKITTYKFNLGGGSDGGMIRL